MPNHSMTHSPQQRNTFVANDYTVGKQLYAAGELIDACTNEEQVRGFMSALKAEADAQTGFWLRSREHRYVDEPEYQYVRGM